MNKYIVLVNKKYVTLENGFPVYCDNPIPLDLDSAIKLINSTNNNDNVSMYAVETKNEY